MKNIKLLSLLLFVLLGIYVKGQTRTVTGQVTDKKTGEPLVGVHVIAYPSQEITITNFDGKYTLSKVQTDDTTIKASIVGYKENSKSIDTGAEVNFAMEETTDLLSEVVVTGTRTLKTLESTPVLTKLVTEQQIEASGATTALDALEFAMPGVSFERDPHTTLLSIQGLNNRYILVLLDGQRLTGETLDQVNMERIDANDIERIEVLGGAASALYGSNAVGSVVNIITKKNRKKWQGSLEGRYSGKNRDLTNNLALGYRGKGLDFRFSGFRRSTKGYQLTSEKDTIISPVAVDYSARVDAAYKISEQLRIGLKGRYFQNDDEDTNPKSTAHKLAQNYTYGAYLDWKPTDKHFVQVKANADEAKQTLTKLENKPDYLSARTKYKTISLVDTYTLNRGLQFVIGAEYNFESVFNQTVFGKDETTKSVNDWNAFVQADCKIVPSLDFVAGLRYTNHETYGSHYTPKFTMMHTLGKFKFRGNIAWGYKAPTMRRLYYNFSHGSFFVKGNPNLEPETSFYTSLSSEYGGKNINVSVNLFKNKLQDKIVGYRTRTKNGVLYTYKNFADVRIKGIETFLNVRFLKNFSSQMGYNYINTKNVETGRQIPGTSRHFGTMGLTWANSKMRYPMTLNIVARVHSNRIYYRQEKKKIVEEEDNGYWICRATYTQDFPIYKEVNLKVQLGVDNIFDYKKDLTVINSGRRFWGGLKLYF